MKANAKWIGRKPNKVKTWHTITAARKDGSVKPSRIAFAFEIAVVDLFDGILLTTGMRAPVHEAILNGHGPVVGLRDMGAIDYLWGCNNDLVLAWRASFEGRYHS